MPDTLHVPVCGSSPCDCSLNQPGDIPGVWLSECPIGSLFFATNQLAMTSDILRSRFAIYPDLLQAGLKGILFTGQVNNINK
jgi:hypothetical protein